LAAWFFDGEVKVKSNGGAIAGKQVTFAFPQYGTTLNATLGDDTLDGMYDRGTRGAGYAFKAHRHVTPPAPSGDVPSIAGDWRILTETSLGEKAWRFVVRQHGADVDGAIMRVDGDTGMLSGRYEGGSFTMSHFSGARPTVLTITPQADGSLQIIESGTTSYVAWKEEVAAARGMPAPADPATHLGVRDPAEKFHFSFPDLNKQIVTDEDPRFHNKVVVVSVTGSWCPNCHDEAPFLAELYKTRRDRGLEIVGLAFEEAGQLENPERLRAFIAEFGLTYTFLIAGEPDRAAELIPQAVNLDTFPATFVLGRDGRVRATHAGYASKATGAAYTEEQKAFVAEIDRLLAEP
ncbi:MAG: redoxin family protein, partial [Acidobacteriaceae bacterium]|nr:redoxin family protein [Acidobacteriaceae bacterium]